MSNDCGSIMSNQGVAKSSRQRVTVDLRSLGPMVQAHAASRGLAQSALIRLAVSSQLEKWSEPPPPTAPVITGHTDTKVTLRLRCGAAQELVRRAKVSGLSYGGYVTMLLNGVNPSMAVDHAAAVDALGRSTALLAPALADLKNAARGASLAAGSGLEPIDVLAQAVHRHLLLASTLLAELRPLAAARRRRMQVR